MTGRIIRGIGGFYTLEDENGLEYVCKARGRFRNDGVKPIVGDFADFEPGKEGDEGFILGLLERKNELLRPMVANLDLLVVTVAAASPQPDFLLIDRLLLLAAMAEIPAIIVVNKCDLTMDTFMQAKADYAHAKVEILPVSAASGEGIPELAAGLLGKAATFAGQSGAGKSSLINLLCPDNHMEVGRVSRIERGRHTTRHAQLIRLPGGGWLVDTPGFSLLELSSLEPSTLMRYYPEMEGFEGECRFLSCQHVSEPDCAVREAAQADGGFSERLKRYVILYNEVKDKWQNRYG